MASAVDICNLALSMLGNAARVSNIAPSDGSAEADLCVRFYPIARDVCLEAHSWGFATKRKALAALAGTPPDLWQYQYALPSDCLKPIAVLLSGSTDDTDAQDYAVEALADGTKVLYTNVPDATLRYVAGITDTTRFTPLFVSALARLLSSYLAGPIIKGKAGIQAAAASLKQFNDVDLPAAKASDAGTRQTSAYRDHVPDWIKNR